MTDKNFAFQPTIDNLDLLACELALNLYDNVSIDIYKDQWKEGSDDKRHNERLREKVLKKKTCKNPIHPRRNILVIGAGATFDAFNSIPLGATAIEEIKKRIIIASGKIKEKNVEVEIEIDFEFYLRFYNAYQNRNAFTPKEGEEGKETYLRQVFEQLTKTKASSEDAKKIFYLETLGEKYRDELERLRLYAMDNRLDSKPDFETSLNVLVKLFGQSTIRAAIADLYSFKYGPTLCYQIIAHLFKNGFIDVIINFNFDELLDRCIEEEMSKSCYDYVFSDGDCNLEYNDGRLRQPLYIKPHGTVSHKSSMRFTKDHYHELPTDMRKFLEDVIGGLEKEKVDEIKEEEIEKEKEKKEEKEEENKNKKPRIVNLITLGFGMESLEFNALLRTHLPKHSKIFNFYHYKEFTVCSKLNDYLNDQKKRLERNFQTRHEKDGKIAYEKNDNFPEIKFIGSQIFGSTESNPSSEAEEIPLPDFITSAQDLGIVFAPLCTTFAFLYENIKGKFHDLFQPSNIDKHLIRSLIFGSKTFRDKLSGSKAALDYFKSADYFKDRFVVESLIHLATNNKLLTLAILMKGNAGYYYSKYLEAEKKGGNTGNPKIKVPSAAKILETLLKSQGKNLFNNINPLTINYPHERESETTCLWHYLIAAIDESKEIILDKDSNPKTPLISKKLADFITDNLKNENNPIILSLFKAIENSNSTRIQNNLRSTIHHSFMDYRTTDLVGNSLHHDLIFYKAFALISENQIVEYCAIVDYGHQLRKFLKVIVEAHSAIKFNLILQFNSNHEENPSFNSTKGKFMEQLKKKSIEWILGESDLKYENMKDRFNIYYLKVEGHNHHMSWFTTEEGVMTGSVYYYKNGLSTHINPIRIDEPENKLYLIDKFISYSKRAKSFMDEMENKPSL